MYLVYGGTQFEFMLCYPKSLLKYVAVLLREMRYCIEAANFSFQIHNVWVFW
jgi:hypothetical protein